MNPWKTIVPQVAVAAAVAALLGSVAAARSHAASSVALASWGPDQLTGAVVTAVTGAACLITLWHLASCLLVLVALRPGADNARSAVLAWGTPWARRIVAGLLVAGLGSGPAWAAPVPTTQPMAQEPATSVSLVLPTVRAPGNDVAGPAAAGPGIGATPLAGAIVTDARTGDAPADDLGWAPTPMPDTPDPATVAQAGTPEAQISDAASGDPAGTEAAEDAQDRRSAASDIPEPGSDAPISSLPGTDTGSDASGPATPLAASDPSGQRSGAASSTAGSSPSTTSTTPSRDASPTGDAAGETSPGRALTTGSPLTVPATVAVSSGDCLWSITADLLGPGADEAEVARAWPRLYAANASVIGADPSVIRSGTVLTVPAGLSPTATAVDTSPATP